MSTFKAFQTGLMVGQQQRQVQAEQSARTEAADAFKSGNYEGAVAPLMRTGLMADAEGYYKAGQRRKEGDRTKAYGDAYKMGLSEPGGGPVTGLQAARDNAAGQGDFDMAAGLDKYVASTQAEELKAAATKSMAAASLAFDLRGMPPEKREGARAAWIQTHGAATGLSAQDLDGPLDDESLDVVMNAGVTLAEKVKAKLAAEKPIEVSKGASLAVPNGKGGFTNAFTAPDASADGEAGALDQLDDDAITNAAVLFNQGQGLPPLGMGKPAAAKRTLILNRAAQIAREGGVDPYEQAANRADITAAKSSLTKLDNMATAVSAFEKTFHKNVAVMSGFIDKVDNSGAPFWNKWVNRTKASMAGDAELAGFTAAMTTVVAEYAKIMSGSMGNTPVSDSARKEAEEMINTAQSPAQLRKVIGVLQKDAANRMEGIEEERGELRKRLTRKPGKAEDTAAAAAASIPPAAIAHLKANPVLASAFDEKFGAGAAAKALGH